MSRAAKYTVFDATKEIAFVPLSPEMQINGKASIDGICSRMGKSGGSMIYQGLLLSFGTLSASAPYVALFLFTVLIIWIIAVKTLGDQFQTLTAQPPIAVGESAQAA
jgi:ATP/ADP translocase